MDGIEIAKATVQGRRHREIGKNNQDALCIVNKSDVVIGLVADGCGSCEQSEVGSNLAVRMIAQLIEKNYTTCQNIEGLLEKVRLDCLAEFRVLINQLGISVSRSVNDFFLFTLVGFILTPEELVVFSLGDGIAMVNDEIIKLGPFPHNEPPYLMYALTGSTLANQSDDLLKFQILKKVKFDKFAQVIIGTDGIDDLIAKEGENLPGKKIVIPVFKDFVGDDKLFKNSDLLRRKLSLINRDVSKYKKNLQRCIVNVICEKGLLEDDTTLIIVRKGEDI